VAGDGKNPFPLPAEPLAMFANPEVLPGRPGSCCPRPALIWRWRLAALSSSISLLKGTMSQQFFPKNNFCEKTKMK
jgi:hypothetical protein